MRNLALAFTTLLFFVPGTARAEYGVPSVEERRVVQLINQNRARQGLRQLIVHQRMQAACQKHADNMAAQQRGSGELDGRNVADRLLTEGYDYYNNGETIYWASRYPNNTIEGLISWLFKTEEHRDKALNSGYLHIGVGIRVGADQMTYFCIDYGSLGVNID